MDNWTRVALCSLWLTFPTTALSDPLVDLTLIVVPEEEACKPEGYRSYGDEGGSRCKVVTTDVLEIWKALEYIEVQRDVPPGKIQLGEPHLRFLSAYETVAKTNLRDRKSIVVIFDWNEPQNADITLSRSSLHGSQSTPFPSLTWHGRLENARRFIHHEGSDDFLPAHRTLWKLTVEDEKWTLITAR